MFSKSQLLDAIEELEDSPSTYQNAEKLATFYLLYDHLYVEKEPMNRVESVKEVKVDRHGDSDFFEAISDKEATEVWSVIGELMEAVNVLQPKLYRATLERIKAIKP